MPCKVLLPKVASGSPSHYPVRERRIANMLSRPQLAALEQSESRIRNKFPSSVVEP